MLTAQQVEAVEAQLNVIMEAGSNIMKMINYAQFVLAHHDVQVQGTDVLNEPLNVLVELKSQMDVSAQAILDE